MHFHIELKLWEIGKMSMRNLLQGLVIFIIYTNKIDIFSNNGRYLHKGNPKEKLKLNPNTTQNPNWQFDGSK